MDARFERLSHTMNLTPYQAQTLAAGGEKYDVSRLVKRGPVLYAPYAVHGVWENAARMFMGRRADLIGKTKILLRAQRRIKFFAGGFHCVRIGRFMYYADAGGAAISRDAFRRALGGAAR